MRKYVFKTCCDYQRCSHYHLRFYLSITEMITGEFLGSWGNNPSEMGCKHLDRGRQSINNWIV